MQKWGQSQDLVHDETFSAGPCGDVNAGYSGEAWQGENCSKMIWVPLALWFCASGLQDPRRSATRALALRHTRSEKFAVPII